MPQTTIRASEELLEEVEEATGPEESRSEWIREAMRRRLAETETLEERLQGIEERLSEVEERQDEPLYRRLL
jgi:metal-responsive CopG/Arc/MetJ family transcriptional regulator